MCSLLDWSSFFTCLLCACSKPDQAFKTLPVWPRLQCQADSSSLWPFLPRVCLQYCSCHPVGSYLFTGLAHSLGCELLMLIIYLGVLSIQHTCTQEVFVKVPFSRFPLYPTPLQIRLGEEFCIIFNRGWLSLSWISLSLFKAEDSTYKVKAYTPTLHLIVKSVCFLPRCIYFFPVFLIQFSSTFWKSSSYLSYILNFPPCLWCFFLACIVVPCFPLLKNLSSPKYSLVTPYWSGYSSDFIIKLLEK